MISSRLLLLAVFLAAVFSANAQDLPRLRDSESPDHRYDVRLLNTGGKLRYQIRVMETGKLFGDVTSVYEAQQTALTNAPELARMTRAYWSPDERYVVLCEPDNSAVPSSVMLVSVDSDTTKRLSVDVEEMKTLSGKKHTTWSVEFGDWIGNRAFFVKLYGMTFHNDRANEHDLIPVICRIRKNGGLTMLNANE